MKSTQQGVEYRAYEVNASTGLPDRNGLNVMVGYYTTATQFTQYSYPLGYYNSGRNPKYPFGQAVFDVGFSNEGFFKLGARVLTYSDGQEKALTRRQGDFVIKDDHKFILNTTSAEWRGVEGEPYFLQFQISTFAPSNTVFKLCLHEYFPGVRRLACTLHNVDTGAYRGTQVLDDSRSLGVIEYLPIND